MKPNAPIGVKAGSYVKVTLKNLPFAFKQNFDPRVPLLLGGVATHQTPPCLLKCRADLHLRQKKPLKSNVASLVSLGWHRVQAAAVFCGETPNSANSLRYLKCTPKMVSSYAMFYGFPYPAKTGLIF